MQVIFVVLNKTQHLNELLTKLKKAGISGGTILDSTGMVKTIDDSDEGYILGSLKLFLDDPYPNSKTLFFVVKDEQVDIVRKTVNLVLGDINKPNTGIIFGMPLTFVDGINNLTKG